MGLGMPDCCWGLSIVLDDANRKELLNFQRCRLRPAQIFVPRRHQPRLAVQCSGRTDHNPISGLVAPAKAAGVLPQKPVSSSRSAYRPWASLAAKLGNSPGRPAVHGAMIGDAPHLTVDGFDVLPHSTLSSDHSACGAICELRLGQ